MKLRYRSVCTRFVFNGDDTLVGFNFEIDLSQWTHKVITEKNGFFIGIKMPDGQYHSFHGVNSNGNVGTLLYVKGNEEGRYCADQSCVTIADLTEQYIKGTLSLDDAFAIVQRQKIVYASDTTMQAMLSDQKGRALIIEPGIGYRLERTKYSLMTNYSLLSPETTRPFIVSNDDRFERAKNTLEKCHNNFSSVDAMQLLQSVGQEGLWATRVSFVYSVRQNKVDYVLNNDFERIMSHQF